MSRLQILFEMLKSSEEIGNRITRDPGLGRKGVKDLTRRAMSRYQRTRRLENAAEDSAEESPKRSAKAARIARRLTGANKTTRFKAGMKDQKDITR